MRHHVTAGPVANLCGCNVFSGKVAAATAAQAASSQHSHGLMGAEATLSLASQAIASAALAEGMAATELQPSSQAGTAVEIGSLTGLPPAWLWLLDRHLILAAVAFLVLLPLCLRRHMSSLSSVAFMGLMSLAAFLGAVLWLTCAALLKGLAHPLRWGPDLESLGKTDLQRVGAISRAVL